MAEIQDDGKDCPINALIIEVWKHSELSSVHTEVAICQGSIRQKLERKSFRWGEQHAVTWETIAFWPNTIGIRTITLMFVPLGEDRMVHVTPMISYCVGTYDRNIILRQAEFSLIDDAADATLMWQIPEDVVVEEEDLFTEPERQLPDVKEAFSTPPQSNMLSAEYDVISECGKYKATFDVKYVPIAGPGTRGIVLEADMISDILSIKNGSTLLSGDVKFSHQNIQAGLERFERERMRPHRVVGKALTSTKSGENFQVLIGHHRSDDVATEKLLCCMCAKSGSTMKRRDKGIYTCSKKCGKAYKIAYAIHMEMMEAEKKLQRATVDLSKFSVNVSRADDTAWDSPTTKEIELKEIKRCMMCSDTNSSEWFTVGDGTYKCVKCQRVEAILIKRCTQAFVQEDDTMCKQCRLITPKPIETVDHADITDQPVLIEEGTGMFEPRSDAPTLDVRRSLAAQFERVPSCVVDSRNIIAKLRARHQVLLDHHRSDVAPEKFLCCMCAKSGSTMKCRAKGLYTCSKKCGNVYNKIVYAKLTKMLEAEKKLQSATVDLSKFSVNVSRIDGATWDSPTTTKEIELKEIKRCVMCSDTNSSGWFTVGDGTYKCVKCQGPKCERCTQAFVQEDDTMCKQCRLITPKPIETGKSYFLFDATTKTWIDGTVFDILESSNRADITDQPVLIEEGTGMFEPRSDAPTLDVRRSLAAQFEHEFMSTKDGQRAVLLIMKEKRTISDEIHLAMLKGVPVIPFPVLGHDKCETMRICFAANSEKSPPFVCEFDDKSCFALPLDYTNYKCIVIDAGLINLVRKDVYEEARIEARDMEGDCHVNFKACVSKLGHMKTTATWKKRTGYQAHICDGDDCGICLKHKRDYKCIDCGLSECECECNIDDDDSSEGPPPLEDVPPQAMRDDDDSSEGPPPLVEDPRNANPHSPEALTLKWKEFRQKWLKKIVMEKLKRKARHILIAWVKEQKTILEKAEAPLKEYTSDDGSTPKDDKGKEEEVTMGDMYLKQMTEEYREIHIKRDDILHLHYVDAVVSIDFWEKTDPKTLGDLKFIQFKDLSMFCPLGYTVCAPKDITDNAQNLFVLLKDTDFGIIPALITIPEDSKWGTQTIIKKFGDITKGVLLDFKVVKAVINGVDMTEEYQDQADTNSVTKDEAVFATPKKTSEKPMNVLERGVTVIPTSFSKEAYDRMVKEQEHLSRLIVDQKQRGYNDTPLTMIYLKRDYNKVSIWLKENSFDCPFDCPACNAHQPMDHSCSIEKLENMDMEEDNEDKQEEMSSRIKYTQEELREVRDNLPPPECRVIYGDMDGIFVKVPIDKVKSYGLVCGDKHIVVNVLDVNKEPDGNYELRMAQQEELAQLKLMRDSISKELPEKIRDSKDYAIRMIIDQHNIVCARITALVKEMQIKEMDRH
jgi:hypothetical protein